MQANRAAKRDDRSDPASKAKHNCETSERPDLSQSAASAPKIEIKLKPEPETAELDIS
jgi:hypothetical protein